METGLLLSELRWADRGADEFAIEAAQSQLGVRLPTDYLTVLRNHNGGEGWVGVGAYLRLWPIAELCENNRTLEAARLIPGMVLFGTDGADELYAVDPNSDTYFAYPAVGLSTDLGRKLGTSWESFLQTLAFT
jgi:hypothetical protein